MNDEINTDDTPGLSGTLMETIMSDITGRDGYIIWQALTYAITAIDSLPQHERELSNQDDMRAIRDAIFPEAATSLDRQRDAQNIRRKFGLPPVSETV